MRRAVATALAALLIAPMFATAADDHDTASLQARWLTTRNEFAERFDLPKRATMTMDWAYLTDAGDLDGDGGHDLVDVRTHAVQDDVTGYSETVRVEAHRGTDGKSLWNATVPAGTYVFVLPAKVGAQGKPGLVVVTYGEVGASTLVAGGGAYNDAISAYDNSGKQAWRLQLPGAGAGTLVAGAAAYGSFAGFVDAVPGGATELLVRTGGGAGAMVTDATVSQYQIVDSATGTMRPFGAPFAPGYVDASAGGDLDRDGAEDVLTVYGGTLSALRGKDGSVLWTLPGVVGSDDFAIPDKLAGDVTGDGVTDVSLTVLQFDEVGMSGELIVVDGAKGKVTAELDGLVGRPTGNLDGRSGAELLVVGVGRIGPGSVTAGGYTATGKRLWSMSKEIESEGSSSMTSWRRIGDVQPDGALDFAYLIEVRLRSGKTIRREGLVDGRTGRVSALPASEMGMATNGFDGRGADFYSAKVAKGVLTVTTFSGTSRRKLWTAGVSASGTVSSYASFTTKLDGDKCDDLIVSVPNDDSTTDIVFDGGTGKPLWSVRRTGDAAGQVAKPAVRSSRVFKRSC